MVQGQVPRAVMVWARGTKVGVKGVMVGARVMKGVRASARDVRAGPRGARGVEGTRAGARK